MAGLGARLVREGRAQALHDGSGGEVFRRDELDASSEVVCLFILLSGRSCAASDKSDCYSG